MDEGDGGALGGGDGPALAQKVDLVVGVDPAFQMEGQVQVQQGGWRARAGGRPLLGEGLFPGGIGTQPRRAADRGILALQLAVEHDLGGRVAADLFIRQEGHEAVIRELLARGADVSARANDGSTALHAASANGHAEALRELLKRPDVALNAQTTTGFTPLMETCLQGHLMAATLLIGNGADLALLNNAGESALRIAEELVASDEEEGDEGDDEDDEDDNEDATPPRDARHEEHRCLVAQLKAHHAP